MAKRVLKIDALTLPDHHYLDAQDICYYAGEYTAGEGHAYSETNQLILNFKKSVDKRGTAQWQYKERAILQAAAIFRAAIKADAEITFVPIPPSKAKSDPLYDDRMLQLLQAVCRGRHTANYQLDESLAEPAPPDHFCRGRRAHHRLPFQGGEASAGAAISRGTHCGVVHRAASAQVGGPGF